MKSISFLLIVLTLLSLGCGKKNGDTGNTNSAMEMDSQYASDKNAVSISSTDTIRLDELKKFEDYPNIMQADIDAGKRIKSTDVQYMKPGDKIRISESGGDNKKTK